MQKSCGIHSSGRRLDKNNRQGEQVTHKCHHAGDFRHLHICIYLTAEVSEVWLWLLITHTDREQRDLNTQSSERYVITHTMSSFVKSFMFMIIMYIMSCIIWIMSFLRCSTFRTWFEEFVGLSSPGSQKGRRWMIIR